MKYISLPLLIFCILVPPFLYVVSLGSLEKYLEMNYAARIEDNYANDPRLWLSGNVRLQEVMGRYIDAFLAENSLRRMGVKVAVLVTTEQGTVLYPSYFDPLYQNLESHDPVEVASQNFALLNEHPRVEVDVTIDHSSPVALGILGCLVLGAVGLLFFHYRSGLRKFRRREAVNRKEVQRLTALEMEYAARLKYLETERESLATEMQAIEALIADQKQSYARNEDEMIQEIIRLEEKYQQKVSQYAGQEAEILDLKDQILAYERKQKQAGARKEKEMDAVRKRFNTLYKHLLIHDRALKGYLDLVDDMRLKSEELIHKLNDNPELVTVRRKLFNKKKRETILEVLFAYNGRLYFRHLHDNRIEVLAIGTKNTQEKDLEFLTNLPAATP